MQDSPAEIQFRLHAVLQKSGTEPDQTASRVGGHLPRVTRVMALAIHFQDMIRRGEARDYADLARLGCVTRERMSQVMELIWLAPDIQQEILCLPPTPGGRYPISELCVRKISEILSWERQRDSWGALKIMLDLDGLKIRKGPI